jgi:biopolymer transport protein ExbD
MSRNRSIRARKVIKATSTDDVDITSLLDILTILLLFLVASNSFTGEVINVIPDLTLAKSETRSPNQAGVIIQVSQKELWVDNIKLLDLEENDSQSIVFDQGGRRIVPLFNELVKKKDEINAINKEVPKAKEFSGIANLVFDEKLRYDLVKKVMYTAAEAGFVEYKFIVLGEQ